MTHRASSRFSRPSFVCLALTLAFASAACKTAIVGGGGPGGSGGGGASTGSSTPTAPPGPVAPSAIAILASQMGWDEGGSGVGGGSSTGTGGSGVDPNMLYLELGDPAPTCSTPTPILPCGGYFTVAIGIPPALQQVGTIPLSSPELIAFMGETGPLNDPSAGPDDCPGGGGSFIDGSLEIESIDASQVTFRLTGTTAFDFTGISTDGEYVAARCP